MRFTDGTWSLAPGVETTPMRTVFRVDREDAAVVLHLVDRLPTGPWQRVEGTSLTLRISAPQAGTVRLTAVHHAGQPDPGGLPWELVPTPAVTVTCVPLSSVVAVGDLEVEVIHGPPLRIIIRGGGAELTRIDAEDLLVVRAQGQPWVMARLALAPGETIYGLGERFSPLVRNGQSVSIWNEDAGTGSDHAYKNIPFYLSSAGYGLLANHPQRVEFAVGSERVGVTQVAVPGERLDLVLFHGPQPKQVLERYTALLGRPVAPPAWSFGLWLTTSFLTNYDETTVTAGLDQLQQAGIPLSVFHFDCFWMRERQWCDFAWDTTVFPDPVGMIKRYHDRGLKVCVWINPYISQHSPLFAEGARAGHLLMRSTGGVYQRDEWQPGMALLDVSSPAAIAWYCAYLGRLLDQGVDCFKTDFGERIPTEGVVWHNGSDPQAMRNRYAHLYNEAVFRLLESRRGAGEAVVFARSAHAGAQKLPLHWGGDCKATWASMAESLRGGLSFLMSGPAFWSHDIGGFDGEPDPVLYRRWVAFGLLSSHSRLHGATTSRAPWRYGEDSVRILRAFTRLKHRLMPYLLAASQTAVDEGAPMMRAMWLEFPQDPTCRTLDRQYLLGGDLVVAPVFRADGWAEWYLPGPGWRDWFTGALAGGWQRAVLPEDRIPLWVRPGALIPLAANDDRPEVALADGLVLLAPELADGASTSCRAQDAAGNRATFHCQREGSTFIFTADVPFAFPVTIDRAGSITAWADLGQPCRVTERTKRT